MKIRIAIYGGTNLGQEVQKFVKWLTERLLAIPEVAILSGGFLHYAKHPDRASVDLCVAEAAESCLTPAELNKRFETWLPLPALDRPGVKRFRKGQVLELKGTSQARRFKLVQEADGLVTIAGKEHTRSLLELALALEKPALPIPFTGGDSLTIWKRNRNDLLPALRLSQESAVQFDHQPSSTAERKKLAATAAGILYAAAERRCLVLMPFGGSHDRFYTVHLCPAIKRANFVPHRIDKDDYASDIPTLFHEAVDRSSAAVVDLTGMNSNILYELGYLHAKSVAPLLLCRTDTGRTEAKVPFYLLQEKIVRAEDDAGGRRQIAARVEQYLRSASRPTGSLRGIQGDT